METTVGSYEAKTHLPSLLEKVGKGEQITITKHGLPIAKLVPIAKSEMTTQEAIDGLLKLSSKVKLNGLSIKEMLHEGHKY